MSLSRMGLQDDYCSYVTFSVTRPHWTVYRLFFTSSAGEYRKEKRYKEIKQWIAIISPNFLTIFLY